MRDQTRKTMKAELDRLTSRISVLNGQIDQAQEAVTTLKIQRDEVRAERDLVKADLDAEPEV